MLSNFDAKEVFRLAKTRSVKAAEVVKQNNSEKVITLEELARVLFWMSEGSERKG